MKRTCARVWWLLSLLLLLAELSFAQVATGTPPFSSLGGGPFDVIDLGNLNAHFAVPVIHKAGRAGYSFTYDLSYDSSIWTTVTSNGTPTWTPNINWGWRGQTEAATGYIPAPTVTQGSCTYLNDAGGGRLTDYYYKYVYNGYWDKFGVHHYVPGLVVYDPSSNCGPQTTSITKTALDGSGWTVTVSTASDAVVTSRSGQAYTVPVGTTSGGATEKDTNGNEITVNSSGQFFDTLSSTTPVLTITGSGTSSSPLQFGYIPPANESSGTRAYVKANYVNYTVKTNFGVTTSGGTAIAEYGPTSVALVDNITLADGSKYSFTYEQTPGSCTPLSGTTSCVTGRILTITLPTGGTITYGYTGGPNNTGIYPDGSTAGLTRALSPSTSCSSGCWQYSRALVSGNPGTGSTWTTQVTDPNGNQTSINFAEDGGTTAATYYFYETQRQVKQLVNGAQTLLVTTVTCYNGNYASCSTALVSSPITQTDAYAQLPNGGTRLSEVLYNSYGLVTDDKEYNYGVTLGAAPSSTYLVRETATSYASLGNNIYDKPSSVTVSDWSSGTANTLAKTTYTYDGTTVSTTSGTPQHVSITGSRGNLTNMSMQVNSGGATLSRSFTYYDTGNIYQANDVNGAQTTYVYGTAAQGSTTVSCGNSFATTINEPLSLSRSIKWDCTGGVATQVTDENGNNVASSYTDPDFWRPASVTDQMSNQTTISYIGQTAVEAALQNFNGGNSASDSRTTVDGFGRPILSQRLQGPTATNYDTVEVDYNNVGLPNRSTMPFSAPAGGESSTAPGTTRTYDAVGRVLTVTDADGGNVSYTYTNNDVLQAVSGGQTFQKQFEYDGLGRLTSVCEMTQATGSGTCGQTNAVHGFWTKYTYDALGHLLTVTQNAQATSGQQTRTFVYDMLGRVTSESNPETGNSGVNGTITYTYDSISPCGDGSNYSYPGNLVQKKDNAGNTTCYSYDALHRVLTAGNSKISGASLRKFFYDSKTSYPTGVTIANAKTRLVEAQTTSTSGSVITDEFFSYDQRGELTDVWESTPHSGGYYHTTASYWPTGTLKTLSGIPGVPTINYGANGTGLDGEGRITQVTASSGTSPVTSVTYSTTSSPNSLGALTGVTFGSADSDSFTYDPNTGRMWTYAFSVNSKADTGTLTWNANGTLAKLVINDQIPGTADSQTCNYTYDDLRRVSSASCGSIWAQTFTYDAFGNITKSGSSAFGPLYSSVTNQFTSIPGVTVTYDANGNLLTDNLNSYTWDPNWGNTLTVNNGSTVVTVTYDALGRMAENNAGGTWTEFIYGPTGKLAKANGQTLVKAYIALPGGGRAIYNSSGLAYYRHSDWVGSSRLTSTQARGLYSSSAYAPFGEQYTNSGSADASFTGQDQDTAGSLYDFLARRQSPSQGRWISPDPLGRGAARLASPQTWNRYAYVTNNPLALVDPSGLITWPGGYDDDSSGGGNGGGGEGWGSPPGQGTGGPNEGQGTGRDGAGGGGGGGNKGNNSNCDAACQAAQSFSYALNDTGCAAAVDGGSGAAGAALGVYLDGNNGGQFLTIANIQTGYEPGFFAVTDNYGSYTSIITLNSGPGGFYSIGSTWIGQGPVEIPGNIYMYGIAGYGTMAAQAIAFGHELGHAAHYAGYQSAVVQDNTASAGDPNAAQTENSDLNNHNNEAIGNACFPQGDTGGNQGPLDPPPTDVPAVAKPAKHHF